MQQDIKADVEEFDIYSTADGVTGQPASKEHTGRYRGGERASKGGE